TPCSPSWASPARMILTPQISALRRRPPPRERARNQVNCGFHHAAMETAERARRQGPRTGPFFPLTNRLHCEIGYWARSLGWDRVRVRPNGHRELLLPRIGSAQEMRSCWRQRLKQGYPNSYHPKALRSRKSLRLKALTLVVTRLARSMNVGLIKQASI